MIKHGVTIHNRFDFEFYDTETDETTKAFAENIVLNSAFADMTFTKLYNCIAIGSGTGTLDKARTGLFSLIGFQSATAVETVFDADNQVHKKVKAIVNESSLIGTWREVGLSGYDFAGYLYTHALLKDSEGNPISIVKTNTMVVTVYATIYGTLNAPAVGHFNVAKGACNQILRRIVGLGGYENFIILSSLRRKDGGPSIMGARRKTIDAGYVQDAANKRVRSNVVRLGVNDANIPIRGLFYSQAVVNHNAVVTYNYGGTTIPTAGVCEGMAYTGVAIGTGDGVETAFDFPIDFVKPESEAIYVDGILKNRGIDYTIHYGQRQTETIVIDTSGGYDNAIWSDTPSVGKTFSEEIEIPQPEGAYFTEGATTVTRVEFKSFYGMASGAYTCEMSEDGTIWDMIVSGISLGSNGIKDYTLPTPKKYKYIRMTITCGSTTFTGILLEYLRVYGTPPVTKHIVFTTPPEDTKAITANFSIDYINKTTNYVLDLQAEIQFGGVQV